MNQRNKAVIILLLVIGILIYLVFITSIGISYSKVSEMLLTVNHRYLLLALICDTNFILFYALAWHALIKIVLPNAKLKDSLLAVIMGWLGDMIIPAAFVTGEAIRLYYFNKKYGLEYSRGIATVLVHRLLSAIAFVLFIMAGSLYLFLTREVISRSVLREMFFVVVATSLLILALLLLITNPTFFEKILLKSANRIKSFLAKIFFKKHQLELEDHIKRFVFSVSLLNNNRSKVLTGFMLLMIQWTFGILVPYNVFRALNYPVGFWVLSLAYPVYGVADNIPLGIPVNVGVLDTAMTSTFILLGIEKNIATTATLITRFITVVYEAVLTGIISLLFGIREILREYKKFSK